MAKKKITDLQLIASVGDGLNIPGHDGIQTYRFTSDQLKAYVLAAGNVSEAALAADAVTTAKILNGAVTRDKLAVGAVAKQATSSKSANYTLLNSDDMISVDASGGARTIMLPALSGNDGKIFTIRKSDSSSNAVIIDGNASETIEGVTTLSLLRQRDTVTLMSNGTEWFILSRRTSMNSESLFTTVVSSGASTNTCIAVLGTTLRSTMGAHGIITYANNAVEGASFTALKRCLVNATYQIGHSGSYEFGWSLNADTLADKTTFIGSLSPASKRLTMVSTSGVTPDASVSFIMEPMDVIRPHTKAGGAAYVNTPLNFTALEL